MEQQQQQDLGEEGGLYCHTSGPGTLQPMEETKKKRREKVSYCPRWAV